MTNYATKGWSYRNAWPLSSGEIAVRESLVKHTTLLDTSGILGGFTVKNPRTGVVWHYRLSSTGVSSGILKVFDENFATIQQINLGPASGRQGFSYAIVEDEILICSRSYPTLWGIVGSGLIRAVKVASVNSLNTTAIDVPQGICVGWAGRAVVCDGEALYFSDALAPRTFVAENVVVPPGGTIYGMHVNAGGALILCTAGGVYALGEDAAASGQIVVGIFSKLTDYNAIDYETTCSAHGKVFGLTEKGYRRIDIQGSEETFLDEPVMSRSIVPRIHFEDYRLGRIFGGDHGPIVSIGGFANLSDLATNLVSWWATITSGGASSQKLDLAGILVDNNGEELYLTTSTLYSLQGNRDDLANSTGTTIGFLAGRINMDPGISPVLRQVEFSTDAQTDGYVFVDNARKQHFYVGKSPVLDTDSWDVGLVYREQRMRSRRTQWASRTDEVVAEVQINEWPGKIPESISLEFAKVGRNRPNT